MRIYIISNDGITLCREPPTTVNDGEIAVASNEELHAAPLSAKRLPDGDPGPRDAGHGRRPPPLRRRRSSHDWKAIVLEPSLIGRVLTRRILRRTIGLAP